MYRIMCIELLLKKLFQIVIPLVGLASEKEQITKGLKDTIFFVNMVKNYILKQKTTAQV
jgi:hypothetical protein